MYRTAKSHRVIGLAVTTAMAGALLAGCTTNAAPPAMVSANKAEAALAKGKHEVAIAHAEAAVLADPRNSAYRAMLGNVYLDGGRFASAATSFDDAMQLGDTSTRTALSLALALTGEGKSQEAAALLNSRDREIPAADLGLALALAGQPDRGVQLMANAIRHGQNNAKMRQNLAYAYALAGRWREAQLMAAQDVPADKLSARMEEWARMARPESTQQRVAMLLRVPAGVSDAGQPVQLALANTPSFDQLAAEASTFAAPEAAPLVIAAQPAPAPAAELPALPASAPVAQAESLPAPEAPRPSDFQRAFAMAAPSNSSPAPVAPDTARFVQQSVVQPTPARQSAAPVAQSVAPARQSVAPARQTAAAPVRQSAAPAAAGSHLIQLGSFASEQGARRAWGIYVKNYPELSGHQMVISEAVVRGKRYWRVSAAGFGKSSSSAMCGRVRASGAGCFAYAEGRPMPGAVDNGVRLARR